MCVGNGINSVAVYYYVNAAVLDPEKRRHPSVYDANGDVDRGNGCGSLAQGGLGSHPWHGQRPTRAILERIPTGLREMNIVAYDNTAGQELQHCDRPGLYLKRGCTECGSDGGASIGIHPQSFAMVGRCVRSWTGRHTWHTVPDRARFGLKRVRKGYITDQGILGIHRLIKQCPMLRRLDLTLTMENSALTIAAWQILLSGLPPGLLHLTLMLFVLNHRHFVPIVWELPLLGWLNANVPSPRIWYRCISFGHAPSGAWSDTHATRRQARTHWDACSGVSKVVPTCGRGTVSESSPRTTVAPQFLRESGLRVQ